MTDKAKTLELEPQGDHWVLSRVANDGTETSIILAPDDVLTLAHSAQRTRDRIHTARNPKGSADVTVGSATPVAQVRLNTDIHETCVLMGMIEPRQTMTEFSLPLEVAQSVAASLPRWVAKLEAAAAAKKVQ